MFIGHFAPAFVAASLGPRAPKLGTAFVAAQLVDWAFFGLALLGVEKMRIEPGATVMVPFDLYHMPYTHSLLGSGLWALAFALIVGLSTRNSLGAVLAGLVVMSHWLLDWVAHRPDLTLAGGEAAVWPWPVELSRRCDSAGNWHYIGRVCVLCAPYARSRWATDGADRGDADFAGAQLVWSRAGIGGCRAIYSGSDRVRRTHRDCCMGWGESHFCEARRVGGVERLIYAHRA